MKSIAILALLFFLPSCRAKEVAQGQQAPTLPPIQVYFSPKGGCTEAVVKEIDAAKSTILVQAYSFTSDQIAKALVEANKRGVKIQVILDRSNRSEKYSPADFVLHAGVPVFIDANPAVPVAGGFVASKNSKVFHKSDCKSAAKILEKNLVRYNNRDEAIQAGKKPCAECRP